MKVLRPLLLISAILALLSLTLLLLRAQWTLEEMRLLVVDGRQAAKTWNSYSTDLTKQLQSEKNQKAIDAGLSTLASFQATARLINTQVVPRTMRLLEASEQTTLSLNALVANTDKRLTADDGLLRDLQASIAALRLPVEQVTPKLVALMDAGLLTVEDVRSTIASPEFAKLKELPADVQRLLVSTTGTMDELKRGTANIATGLDKFPSLMAELEKFAQTTNKYQKAVILARIASLLGGIFVP